MASNEDKTTHIDDSWKDWDYDDFLFIKKVKEEANPQPKYEPATLDMLSDMTDLFSDDDDGDLIPNINLFS